MDSKRGQVTIFIIIAVLILAAVGAILVYNNYFKISNLSPEIEPVYNTFLECVEEEVLVGVDVLESQAGFIDLLELEEGNSYAPFSSQLDFAGAQVPYWYYLSRDGSGKEQVPTKSYLESELENYLEANIRSCDFSSYYDADYEISLGEPDSKIEIEDNEIKVEVKMDLTIVYGDQTSFVKDHSLSIGSFLGELYEAASTIYDEENSEFFLERYGIDIVRLYAPVDGVEMTCSPLIWNADTIFSELRESLEANTLSLSNQKLSNDYFLYDFDDSFDVRFINSQSWPSYFEVLPADSSLLMAEPVGNQEGLGVLGFCYVPYHFVYNVRYPVMVQISKNEETFQFPIVVVIEGTQAREALNAESFGAKESLVCEYQETPMQINVVDLNGDPVDARISYDCLGSSCYIGETTNGVLAANFPQCINGYVYAIADGYNEGEIMKTVVEGGSATIILSKKHDLNVDLYLDAVASDESAVITFTSESGTSIINYPLDKSISLSEDVYEVSVSVFSESSVEMEATTSEQCYEVPRSGVGALLGLTKEVCYDVEVPAKIFSEVLVGGGKTTYYLTESDLKSYNSIAINVESLGVPTTLNELQDNYELVESKSLEIELQ